MIIDIKQIIEYCKCPMYYKYRYIDNVSNNVINVLDKYDLDIHKTIYLYFLRIQKGQSVTVNTLKQSWGRLWLGNKTVYDIMYQEPSSWRDTKNEKRKKGIETIIDIHKYYSKNVGCPIVINKQYKVNISKSITLTGMFEVVREVDDVIELIDFKVDDKVHNKFCVDNDIEITAASYAFRKLFNTKEDRILYHGLNKNKINMTNRTEDSYKNFLNTVTNVCKCIHNNIFYMCPEENKCYTCIYKSQCIKNTI